MSQSRCAAYAAWMVASVFYAYQYVLRVIPNIIIGDILQQFHIDTATFGQFAGIYYIGYSLMHLPLGIMLDRFGPKKVMPICMLMTVVGMLPLMFAEWWVYPLIGRLLVGMGSSAAILGIFKIIRLTFPEIRFTRMLSLSVTIGLLGAIYGGGPVDYMCALLGYKVVVGIFACIGLCLSVVTYILVPATPIHHTASITRDVGDVFSSVRVMAICFFSGLMVGPLEGFADVWGTGFLKQVYGFDGIIAASLPSCIFLGMCFGGPLLSVIAERTGNYIGTIIGAGFVMAVAFFALLSGMLSTTVISILFVIVGICCAYQIIAIYTASTYVKEHLVGLTSAVANMIIMIFGAFFHTSIGWVIDSMGGPNSSVAYTYGVGLIPIALVVGILGFVSLFIQSKVQQSSL